jgi:uncharacterized protein (TIGR00375 family)
MSPENLWKWAQLKGISLMGTGDFTHPLWFKELNDKLEQTSDGVFSLTKAHRTEDVFDSCRADINFILTAEISCIYKKNGKTRKVHSIVMAPDFASASKINKTLSKIGNLNSDGRPILGLDAKELLKIVLDSSSDAVLIPAHVWTPHFSVFGSESGFDSLEECFDELTPHIFAIETGLSSDPPMNWRLSELDRITLLSNSDAHSPSKIGREANIFNTEISYKAMMEAIKTREGFTGTIEFFPEEGKYHYDGHRTCGISLTPHETLRHNYLCPVCGKRVTVGVMHRIEKLANRQEGFKPKGMPSYYSIIPLPEIIAEVLKVGANSKAVDKEYRNLLNKLGNEFKILMDVQLKDIEQASSTLITDAILKVRKGDVHIAPGYDGEYGKVKIFEAVKRKEIKGQSILF